MSKSESWSRWALGALFLGLSGCGTEYGEIENLGGAGWGEANEEIGATENRLNAGDVVSVERIKHCRHDNILCNDVISRPEYQVWEKERVADTRQKQTYLARISDPGKAAARYVAFFAAGQQDFSILGVHDSCIQKECGNENNITGQGSDWKRDFKNDKTLWRKDFALETSLATQVLGDVLPLDQTFAIGAWDTQFNHELRVEEKQDIENAYYEYLKTKFDENVVRVIYLAGHSRGGCLVMRLARRFNQDFPNLPVIVHSFDGVCTKNEGELGTTSTFIDNPVASDGDKAYATNLEAQFSHESSLFALTLVAGDPVLGSVPGVYAFSEERARQPFNSFQWLAQQWFAAGHASMEGTAQRARALDHLRYHFNRVNCPTNQKWGTQGCATPACPVGEGIYDGANCWIPTPPGRSSFIHQGGLYWTPGPECPLGTHDGANCLVASVPGGSMAFIHQNNLYYTGQPTCSRGTYDGANCYLGGVPAGRNGFIYNGNLYYSAGPTKTCPLAGSWYDGANCFVASGGERPFLWNNNLYVTPVKNGCPVPGSQYDGANCFVATPPSGTTPFVHENRLYTSPRMNQCSSPSQYDGANCYLGRPNSTPFSLNGDLYYQEVPRDPALAAVPADTTLVRLQHVRSSRCTFRHMERAYNLGCSSDRDQLFAMRTVAPGQVEFRHFQTGECLRHSGGNGTNVDFGSCGWNDTRFIVEPAGAGTVRLRSVVNQRCLYASDQEGGTSSAWDCWNDPNMEYVLVGANRARGATVSVPSTFGGYSAARINDGDRSTALGGGASWVNSHSGPNGTVPQAVEFAFSSPTDVSQVVVYTTNDYRISDYDVEVLEGSSWRRVARVQNNTAVRIVSGFAQVRTDRLRLIVRRGPSHQTVYARLNEVEIY